MDAETLEEVKRHINVSTEALRSESRTVAEAVGAQGEEMRREFATLRIEVEEVKSMIRLPYADIDRRFQALREVGSLRSRLERVEARVGS